MIIGDYVLRPDTYGWVVEKQTPPVGRPMYPATFAQALRRVLDESVRDVANAGDVARLEAMVATVAHLYATIGGAAADEVQRVKDAEESKGSKKALRLLRK
jgi:hypothetical protein